MRDALASAMLEPGDIQYVEAHGTGTPLGDPIEMGAIDRCSRRRTAAAAPIVVGSVKTNIGHMEAAAGVGGIVKAMLQLQEGVIYPHIHLETPSRRIPWDRYRVTVPTEVLPWQAPRRRALVNSFGFAGTIATVVLEQAPPVKTRGRGRGGRHADLHPVREESGLAQAAARALSPLPRRQPGSPARRPVLHHQHRPYASERAGRGCRPLASGAGAPARRGARAR